MRIRLQQQHGFHWFWHNVSFAQRPVRLRSWKVTFRAFPPPRELLLVIRARKPQNGPLRRGNLLLGSVVQRVDSCLCRDDLNVFVSKMLLNIQVVLYKRLNESGRKVFFVISSQNLLWLLNFCAHRKLINWDNLLWLTSSFCGLRHFFLIEILHFPLFRLTFKLLPISFLLFLIIINFLRFLKIVFLWMRPLKSLIKLGVNLFFCRQIIRLFHLSRVLLVIELLQNCLFLRSVLGIRSLSSLQTQIVSALRCLINRPLNVISSRTYFL